MAELEPTALEDRIFGMMVTNVGSNKIAQAMANGTKVDIKTFAVGDGGGASYTPTVTQTDLRNLCYAGEISRYEITDYNPTQIIVTGRIPAEVGYFVIREVGIYDADNDLIAVGEFPNQEKVPDKSGAILDIEIDAYIQFSNDISQNVIISVMDSDFEELRYELYRLKHETIYVASKSDIEQLFGLKWEDPEPEPDPDADCNCGCDELIEATYDDIKDLFIN